MIKIVHVIPNLNSGGAEKFVVDLANSIYKKNKNIYIISLESTENSFFVQQLNPNINVIGLNKSQGFSIRCLFMMFKTLKKINPDIINTHINGLNYILPLIPLLKAKIFHTIHNDAFKESAGLRRILLKNLFANKKIHPITISKESNVSYQKAYENSLASLINNGVTKPAISKKFEEVLQEINGFKKNEATQVLINIARITPQKNHLRLLKTFETLRDKNVILLIIGDKRNDQLNLFEVFKSKISKNIHYLGAKKNIGDYLSCSDAFILSSDFEGLPISLLEAISMGVVPICTPAGGVYEVIENNKIGFVSSELTSNSLRKQVVNFLNCNDENIRQLKQRCKKVFKNQYTIDITANNYLKVYEEK
tara:strand:+ start:12229 stop:13323 length:1095 start_codon:yes stop_codon:yes gene_type:complete